MEMDKFIRDKETGRIQVTPVNIAKMSYWDYFKKMFPLKFNKLLYLWIQSILFIIIIPFALLSQPIIMIKKYNRIIKTARKLINDIEIRK